METITQFRLPNGEVMRLIDWVDKPVFSTLEILTGATDRKISAFTYNVGEPVPATANAGTRRTSTELDTNVDVGGAASSTEELLVYAIKPEYFELTLGTPTDMTTANPSAGGQPVPRTQLLGQLALQLKVKFLISQKAYVDAGLGYFNTGFGPMNHGMLVPQVANNATVRSYGSAGLPSQEAVRTFAVPHHVGGTEKYQLVLLNPSGAAITFNDEQTAQSALADLVYRIRFYLEGMRKRPTA